MNPRYGDYGSWNHMWGNGWWAGIVMTLMMIAVIALVAWAIVTITRGPGHASQAHPPPPAPPSDAHAVLDRRLASGEIDVDEYHRLSEALCTGARHRQAPG